MLQLRNSRILRWYVINVSVPFQVQLDTLKLHTHLGPNHVCLVAMGMVSHAQKAYN